MSELQQVTREIASYKAAIERAEKLERLSSNKDFQELIQNDYLRDNALSLVGQLTQPAYQTPDKQAALHREMCGIGALTDFLRIIRQRAEIAKESLRGAEELRVHLLNNPQEN